MAKSTRPIVRIHNSETDEVIDREMNDAEFEQYEADQLALLAKQAEAEESTPSPIATMLFDAVVANSACVPITVRLVPVVLALAA